jgi:hypothetical protein
MISGWNFFIAQRPARKALRIPMFIFLFTIQVQGSTHDFSGELVGYFTFSRNDSNATFISWAARYLPSYHMEIATYRASQVDLELAGDLYGALRNETTDREEVNLKFQPYRFWLRYSTPRFESRLGLQKITFGSARLFRPLMWFDRLDPRDPLQLTAGVNALRLRYGFANNTGLWGWILYGNRKTKGWERLPSRTGSVEAGGRFQFPVSRGEIAVTFHRRTVGKVINMTSTGELETTGSVIEHRIALDGVWDVGPGLWFEAALTRAPHENVFSNWNTFLTVGSDYTFSLGNGLTLSGEHFHFTTGDYPFDRSTAVDLSGIMVTYPLGFLDQLLGFWIYHWDSNWSYQYVGWQRTYDRWIIYVSGFWSTRSLAINPALRSPGVTGLQLQVIFNHG